LNVILQYQNVSTNIRGCRVNQELKYKEYTAKQISKRQDGPKLSHSYEE
jgi:S-adenosylmethionine hydrolase